MKRRPAIHPRYLKRRAVGADEPTSPPTDSKNGGAWGMAGIALVMILGFTAVSRAIGDIVTRRLTS